MMRTFLLALAVALVLSGCAAPIPKQHVVLIDADGSPRDPMTQSPLSPGEYRAHLDSVFARAQSETPAGQPTRYLVFVQGGMNNLDDSLARAAELTAPMTKDGYYPIFICWDSSLVGSYKEHLLYVRQGRKRSVLGPPLAPLYLLADLGRAITRAPLVWYYQISSDVKSWYYDLIFYFKRAYSESIRRDRAAQEAALQRVDLPTQSLKRAHALYGALEKRYGDDAALDANAPRAIHVSLGGEDLGTWGMTWRGFAYLVTLPTKLVLSPFVDAMGKSAWENMNRRTRNLFRAPVEFEGDERGNAPAALAEALDSPPTGAFSVFMDALSDATVDPVSHPAEITVVGHSMGAIVLSEAMRRYPDPPYKSIVFLGAACSLRDVETAVVPCLRKHPDAMFYNLCLHPFAEVRERQSSWLTLGLDFPPRGTLLVWVDDFLAAPATPLDRTAGAWENAMLATHIFPADMRGRVQIKAFGVGGRAMYNDRQPQRHGDFDEADMRFWMPEFWQTPSPATSR